MRIEKQVLNDALRVLGKIVCQTSPVELYRSVRFVGVPGYVRATVTDGIEVVSVKVEADNIEPVDFCVEFKVFRELVRVAKDYVELQEREDSHHIKRSCDNDQRIEDIDGPMQGTSLHGEGI